MRIFVVHIETYDHWRCAYPINEFVNGWRNAKRRYAELCDKVKLYKGIKGEVRLDEILPLDKSGRMSEYTRKCYVFGK